MQQFPNVIKPAQFHRTLIGVELIIEREKLGISSKAFAKLCGWSQPQQSRLENGVNEVRIGITNKITKVLISLQKS